jgi:hypothetical protein
MKWLRKNFFFTWSMCEWTRKKRICWCHCCWW